MLQTVGMFGFLSILCVLATRLGIGTIIGTLVSFFFLPNGGGYWALVVGIALLAINSMVFALLHISSAIQLRHELLTQNIGRGSVTIIRLAEQRGLRPASRKFRAFQTFTFLPLFVAGIFLSLYPERAAISDQIDVLLQGRQHADLRAPEKLRLAIEALRDEAGHNQVTDVTINSGMIYTRAPLVPGEIRTSLLQYTDGEVHNWGSKNHALYPRSTEEEFSLEDVTWEKILPIWEEAKADFVEMNGNEPSGASEIHVQRSWGETPRSGPVKITFNFVGGKPWGWQYSANADGSGLNRGVK